MYDMHIQLTMAIACHEWAHATVQKDYLEAMRWGYLYACCMFSGWNVAQDHFLNPEIVS